MPSRRRKATTQPDHPSSLQARLGERARATRRGLFRRLGLGALAVTVAVALGWVALVSPVFALDPTRVVVHSAEGTVDLAVVQELTAAHASVPLPRLDTPGLADRLEEITGVRTATVRRAWPRGLDITIVSRVAVAAVPTAGGVALFDDEGVHLGDVASAPEGVPVVDVPLDDDTDHTLLGALAVLAALPPDLRAQVVSWSAENADQVELTLADGVTVRWGGNTENELKAAVLATLRQVPASLYDVSTPRRPITQ